MGTTTPNLGLYKPSINEVGWGTLVNANMDTLDAQSSLPRSYLAGLTLSTAGGSGTITVAAGVAKDNTAGRGMTLASTINKTTSAWAVGNNLGGLDTGAIAASTWYHIWEIMRSDTSVVDVLISLSATAPTMPTSYDTKRRIGSALTDGSSNWTAFTQDGDYFTWSATVLTTGTANPGTSAVTQTLTGVPTGVNVHVLFNLVVNVGANSLDQLYLSDLAQNDEAPSLTAAPLSSIPVVSADAAFHQVGKFQLRSNTSAQIRARFSASDANTQIRYAVLGWWDYRGRNA